MEIDCETVSMQEYNGNAHGRTKQYKMQLTISAERRQFEFDYIELLLLLLSSVLMAK